MTALVHGGGQERDIRSGTLDTPAIAGFAAAVELAVKQQADARRPGRRAARRPGAPGSCAARPRRASSTATPDASRLPGNAHLGFPGCEGDSLLMLLDARGIECSTGSACSAGRAAGLPRAAGHGLRATRRPAARCASPSATPAPPPTSTRVVEAIGPVRRAGPRRPTA